MLVYWLFKLSVMLEIKNELTQVDLMIGDKMIKPRGSRAFT